jgi:hypothetical protein
MSKLPSLLLLLLLPVLAFTQQTTINGSEHPELIPDVAAAQAVFSVHSMYKTPADIANTEKHHAKLNLSPADHAIYDAAMQAHFNSKRRNAAATMTGLLSTLSPDGQTKLKAFIQSEKAHMQYHTQPPIPQEVAQ